MHLLDCLAYKCGAAGLTLMYFRWLILEIVLHIHIKTVVGLKVLR